MSALDVNLHGGAGDGARIEKSDATRQPRRARDGMASVQPTERRSLRSVISLSVRAVSIDRWTQYGRFAAICGCTRSSTLRQAKMEHLPMRTSVVLSIAAALTAVAVGSSGAA